jgi:hypothetical protein
MTSAKKTKLAQMKKFEWTTIDEPLVKELICNFHHDDHINNLQGCKIDLGKARVATILKLPWEGLVIKRKEGYNSIVATLFLGT